MISGLGVGQHKIGLIISGEGGTNAVITVNANIMEGGEGRDPVIAVVDYSRPDSSIIEQHYFGRSLGMHII